MSRFLRLHWVSGLMVAGSLGCISGSCSADDVLNTVGRPAAARVAATLQVQPVTLALQIGDSARLTARLTGSELETLAESTVTWTSQDSTIATISADGQVTARGVGIVTVVASAGAYAGTAEITVVQDSAPGEPRSAPGGEPELPRVSVDTRMPGVTGRVISVAAGGDLQAALNTAQPGDAVEVAAGATFSGNFILPPKSGSGYIIVRSSAWRNLPPEGTRITPAQASLMPKLVSRNVEPALKAPKGSSYWRVVGLEMAAQPATTSYVYSIVEMHPAGASSLTDYPNHIILDHVYIHPVSDATSVQRCVTMNAAYAAVIDSYLAGCHYSGTDAQAIVAWDSPGPLKIVNNYLEGSGENVMFGGAASQIQGLVPADIEIRHNYFFKPRTWIGSSWSIKNLFEIKSARRVLVEGNVFENNWSQSQSGTAILLRSGPDGGCTWCVMEDVTFRSNIVRNSPKAVSVIGWDDGGPMVSKRVMFQNNLFENIGDTSVPNSGGEFWIFSIFNGPEDVVFDHNTVSSGGTKALIIFSDPRQHTAPRFRFTNNVGNLGWNGIMGDGSFVLSSPIFGTNVLAAYAPGYTFAGNVLGIGTNQQAPWYPAAGNYYPASRDALGLVGGALPAGSAYLGKATDGTNPGADVSRISQLTAGVQ